MIWLDVNPAQLEIELPGGKRSLIPFREPMAIFGEDRVTIDPEYLA